MKHPWSLLAALLVQLAIPAWASCPDQPISCDLGAAGWQGTCWSARKLSCAPCGPRHCPTLPTEVPKRYRYPCVEVVQADKAQVDGCSNPLTDPLSNLYKRVFRAACVQHDTCYHNTINIPKPTCDRDFKGNMQWLCNAFYTGTANQAQRASCLSAAEVWFTTVSTVPLAEQLWRSDHAWTSAHCPAAGGR